MSKPTGGTLDYGMSNKGLPDLLPQYGRDTCDGCMRPLSTYNPYRWCGACRIAMVEDGRAPLWEKRLRKPIEATGCE